MAHEKRLLGNATASTSALPPTASAHKGGTRNACTLRCADASHAVETAPDPFTVGDADNWNGGCVEEKGDLRAIVDVGDVERACDVDCNSSSKKCIY